MFKTLEISKEGNSIKMLPEDGFPSYINVKRISGITSTNIPVDTIREETYPFPSQLRIVLHLSVRTKYTGLNMVYFDIQQVTNQPTWTADDDGLNNALDDLNDFLSGEQTIASLNFLSDWDTRDVVVDGGMNITQYTDQTGNGNHATPSQGTQVLTADGDTPYALMTNAVADAINSMPNYWGKTIYVVLESSKSSQNAIHGVTEATDFNHDVLVIDSVVDELRYYRGNGTIGVVLQTLSTVGPLINVNRIYNTVRTAGAGITSIDGVIHGVQADGQEAWDIATHPTIGSNYRKMSGKFRRMLVADRVHSPGEQDVVLSELNGIYGLSAQLWSDQPNRIQQVELVGQSNADGRETVVQVDSNSFDNFLSVTGVNFSNYDGTPPNVKFLDITLAVINPTINIAGGTSNFSNNPADRVGIASFIGRDLQVRDGVPVFLNNHAKGGVILFDDGITNSISSWNSKITTESPVFHLTVMAGHRFWLALEWMQNNGFYPYPSIIIKWQGEEDAHEATGTAAAAYEVNEVNWNAQLLTDRGGDGNIQTIRLHDDNDPGDQPFLSTVIAAQIANNAQHNPSDQTIFDGTTHVTGAGMKVMSDRILGNIQVRPPNPSARVWEIVDDYHNTKDAYVYEPIGYSDNLDAYPVIIDLHGADERGTDPNDLLVNGLPLQIEGGQEHDGVLIMCPQIPMTDATWFEPVMDAARDFMIANYRVDENRIYFSGLSLGGTGCCLYAKENPTKVAAILPVAADTANIQNFASTFQDIAVAVTHGTTDAGAGNSRNAYEDLGNNSPDQVIPPFIHMQFGLGHENAVWNDGVFDLDNVNNIFEHGFDHWLLLHSNDKEEEAGLYTTHAETTVELHDYLTALKITNQLGASAEKTALLARLTTLRATADPGKRYIINFGATGAAGNVNNITSAGVGTTTNLIDSDGNASTIDFEIIQALSASAIKGLNGHSLGLDEDIRTEGFRVNLSRTMKFKQLTTGRKHDVRFYSGRITTDWNKDEILETTIAANQIDVSGIESTTNFAKHVDILPDGSDEMPIELDQFDRAAMIIAIVLVEQPA